MKPKAVPKLDKGNTETSKTIADDVMLADFEVIVFFQFMAN